MSNGTNDQHLNCMNIRRLPGALFLILVAGFHSILLAQPQQKRAQASSREIQQRTNVVTGRIGKSAKQSEIPTERNCFTVESEMKLAKRNPRRLSTEKFEKQLASKMSLNRFAFEAGPVYKIPTIVHVVHNGEPVGTGTNISQAQVLSQFDALNEDYRKLGAGYNEHPRGADIKIEFVPVLVDPQGKPLEEPGIDRVFGYNAYYDYDPIELELKPNTQWNPDQYFNIWVVNFGGGMSLTLGYAQFPSMSGLDGLPADGARETDGIVIGYKYFGRTRNVQAPFNLGRTTTHEVGHWLGLRHIWGDGDCSATDYCEDTPKANGPNQSCEFRDSCPEEGVDMIENYMDYSDDPCMNIFTIDQMTRMRTVLEISPRRSSLIGCQVATPAIAGVNTSTSYQWFEYTAEANEVVTISSIDKTSVDTKLSVYRDCNALPLFKNDNGGGSLQSELTISLEAEETIKLLWEGDESMENFDWDLSVTSPAAGAACEFAVAAVAGNNSVPVTSLRTYWLKYVPTGNGKKITVDGGGKEFRVYRNNCDALQYINSSTSGVTVYDIDADENLFIAFEADGGSFNWTLAESDRRDGESCSDAVAAVEGENVIPYGPPFQYWYTYTMPVTGELSLRASHHLEGNTRLAVFKSCDGALIKESTDTLGSEMSIPLHIGETVKILWDGDLTEENITWYLEPVAYSNGEICSVAKVVEAGVHHTDKTFQWFSFTTTKYSNLKISSVGFTDVNTHLIIKSSCDGSTLYDNDDSQAGGNSSNQSEIVLHGTGPGETYLIGWTEKWSYDGFDWSIEEVDPVLGDNCDFAKQAVVGLNTVDFVPGHQYFGNIFWTKFVVPAAGKKITAFSDKPVDMAIYSTDNCETFTFINSGYGKGQAFNLPAGKEILIIWNADYYVEDFTWTLKVESIVAGDYCSRPKRAVTGANVTPYSPFYYEYIMTQNGSLRVNVQEDEPIIVNISTGCSYEKIIFGGYNEAFVSGLKQGDRVYILVTADYPYHGVNWTLDEIPAKQGDSCEDPLQANYGLNHAEYASNWFTYTTEAAGRLKISSRPFTFTDTDLFVYDGCGGELLAHNDNWWSEGDFTLYFQSEVMLDVEVGQTLLIKWGGNYSYAPFDFEIVSDEPRQGDSCEDPIAAIEGVNNAMKPSPSWFTFTMPRTASLTLSSLGFSEVQSIIEIYDGCEGNLLASDDGSDGSSQSYVHIDELAEGQTVWIKCTGASVGHVYTYDWQLFVGDPTEGLFCQFPAQAQIGTNITPAYTSENYWYTFTMPGDNQKLIITRVSEPVAYYRAIGVLGDCNYNLVYGYGEDRIEISNLAAGEQVLIFFSNAMSGERPESEWTLEVVDLGTGDVCDNAISVLPGLSSCTGASTWYTYTLPKDGSVRISSAGVAPNADTYVEVYDACDGNLLASNDNPDGELAYHSEVLLENLTAGQTIFVRWQTNHPFQVPFNWSLTVEGAVNNAPELDDTFLQILANPANGQVLGTLQAHDADGDDLVYNITDGNEDGAFALHPTTGVVTLVDASLIPDLGELREIEVTVTDRVAITKALVALGIVTSTEGEQAPAVNVYPNPARDIIQVDVLPDVIVRQSFLLNAQGRVVKMNDASVKSFSVRDLEAGIYVLKIVSSVGTSTLKIAVVK